MRAGDRALDGVFAAVQRELRIQREEHDHRDHRREDGAVEHASQHVNLAVVAKAPLARVVTFANERGWRRLRLVSSAANAYNRDYLAETAEGVQRPMLTVFHRDGNVIRHFWSSELFYAPWDPGQDPRHVGTLEPVWNLLDMTPADFLCLHFDQGIAVFLFPIGGFGHGHIPGF